MAKHFDLTIADDRFTVTRKTEAIAAEATAASIVGWRSASQSSAV